MKQHAPSNELNIELHKLGSLAVTPMRPVEKRDYRPALVIKCYLCKVVAKHLLATGRWFEMRSALPA